ncbi:endonuclease/exonuclease/phosphatase family protein [Paraburkholderia lycopersici]|uniref:Metal-dependent hydrolase, endonuclease/exonuclease/phosphatase family n=1 Tax=Paraburkholderia lycopersici TaxID=416944 RepID=A0A1G6KVM9_9BURK|nr:endonuclease/exonuclease/phosphatase family protein [Paraburkholderia lycopersici]SDC35140.1 Metal-dependent hydrolase, endonuclease/exonuclease/phosphatase family [Paraburkholderia lycopersici]
MKLLSWNVQWGRDASGVVDLPRTVREAQRLADFDVLCLQEVTRGFHALPGAPGDDQFAELRALLPGYTVIAAIGADLPALQDERDPGQTVPLKPRRQFGNALATRLPVGQVFRHALPWPADSNSPSMQRVALEAVLDAPGGALRVLVTHLEFYSLRQRLAQVDELRRLQQEAADHAAHPAPAENDTGPFVRTARPPGAIVCGDFNSAWGSEAYTRMLEPLAGSPAFIDAWTALHPGATPPHTAGIYDTKQWSDGPLTCDFVFVTEDLRPRIRSCEIDGATQASDHQPIVLELG